MMANEDNKLRVLSNGALFDPSKGRIVANPGGGTKAFSSVTGRDAVQARIEKKRARLAAGVNAAIAADGKFDGRGMDFVEAIGEAIAITALNPDSSQQIKAAEFILRETGISERQAVESGGPAALDGVAVLVAELAAFASSVAGLVAASGGVPVADGVLVADPGGVAAGLLAGVVPGASAVSAAGDGSGADAGRMPGVVAADAGGGEEGGG